MKGAGPHLPTLHAYRSRFAVCIAAQRPQQPALRARGWHCCSWLAHGWDRSPPVILKQLLTRSSSQLSPATRNSLAPEPQWSNAQCSNVTRPNGPTTRQHICTPTTLSTACYSSVRSRPERIPPAQAQARASKHDQPPHTVHLQQPPPPDRRHTAASTRTGTDWPRPASPACRAQPHRALA